MSGASSPRHLCTGLNGPFVLITLLFASSHRLCTAAVALYLDHRHSFLFTYSSPTVSPSSLGNLTLGSILTGPHTHTHTHKSHLHLSRNYSQRASSLRGESCVSGFFIEKSQSPLFEKVFFRRSYPRYA